MLLGKFNVSSSDSLRYTYIAKAEYYLSKLDAEEGHVFKRVWGFGSKFSASMKEKAHIVSETVGTFKTALDLQSSFVKLQEMDKKKGEEGERVLTEAEQQQRQKLEYEAATKGLEALWRGSKLEVESVLREVCDKTLDDSSVSKQIQRRRCISLATLGKVFYNAKI